METYSKSELSLFLGGEEGRSSGGGVVREDWAAAAAADRYK